MEYELKLSTDDKAELDAYWRGPDAFLCLNSIAQELRGKSKYMPDDLIKWESAYNLFNTICTEHGIDPFE